MSADQSAGALQFDRAEMSEARPATATCANCGATIASQYYEVNGNVVCEGCRIAIDEEHNLGGGAGGFLRATALGLLAAAAGFGIYYGIARLTGYEFGLVAIIVGLMVGAAVRRGSHGRGGWRYQLLAVFLTYTAIVSTHVPFIIEEFRKEARTGAAADTTAARKDSAVQVAVALGGAALPGDGAAPTAAAVGDAGAPALAPSAPARAAAAPAPGLGSMVLGLLALIAFFYAVPFLAGFQNILGIVIIAIGLFEAWKINKRATLNISGPYHVGANP